MDFRELLTNSGLNTLTFRDPYAKIICTSSAVSELGKTLYIDLDTMFSAYCNAGLIGSSPSLNVDIFLPIRGRFMQVYSEAIDRMGAEQYSLIVMDSLNSFYNMYDTTRAMGTGRLNHFLCTVVMLLAQHGRDHNTPVLITSMLRYRKDKGWIQSPASKRLIQHFSSTSLSVERNSEADAGPAGAVVIVEKHPTISGGEKMICKNASIILRQPRSSQS